MSQSPVLTLAAVVLSGAVCQWAAWRLRLPAILFLLLAGVLAGPVAGWLDPDALLGPLLFPFVSLAVAVILFEGSLSLRFSEIRGLEQVVRRLLTGGLLVTGAVAALAARVLAGLDWGLATLFGAVMVVTGPTVIMPMLRTVRPSARVAGILRWEGILIDPIGALLAVLAFEVVVSTGAGNALGLTIITFAKTLTVGILTGLLGGWLLGEALRRDWFPPYLVNAQTLALVFGVFALADLLADESGLLAVTVMGIWLGNRPGVPVEQIIEFKESLSLLLITVLFILLAARLDPGGFATLGWGLAGVVLLIQFIARPAAVWFATRGSTLARGERWLLAWIGPRGIVAAAVSALFALRLEQLGVAGAGLLVPLVFAVISATVVLQSLTAAPLARRLGAVEPPAQGFLILGAHPLARALAQALDQTGLPVLLCDTRWDQVRAARMAGLRVYFGSPLSQHAETALDTTGLGRLLALTPDAHFNALACSRFRRDFGPKALFTLRPGAPTAGSERRETLTAMAIPPSPSLPHPGGGRGGARSRRDVHGGDGRTAFSDQLGYRELTRRLLDGAEVRRTALTETFTLADFEAMHGPRATPLFALDPKGRLEVFTPETPLTPGAGWTLLSLIEPERGGGG